MRMRLAHKSHRFHSGCARHPAGLRVLLTLLFTASDDRIDPFHFVR